MPGPKRSLCTAYPHTEPGLQQHPRRTTRTTIQAPPPHGGKCAWTVLLDGLGQTPSGAGLCNLHRCLRAPAQQVALQALDQHAPSAWHPSSAAECESRPKWLLCSYASDAACQREAPVQLEILRQMKHRAAGPPLPSPAQYAIVVNQLPIGQPWCMQARSCTESLCTLLKVPSRTRQMSAITWHFDGGQEQLLDA